MRTASSAFIKYEGKRIGGGSRDRLPRSGGRPRQLYDYLSANPGVPIRNVEIIAALGMTRSGMLGDTTNALVDFWGMDIRSVPNKYHKCLCGEWDGSIYKDHIAAKIK